MIETNEWTLFSFVGSLALCPESEFWDILMDLVNRNGNPPQKYTQSWYHSITQKSLQNIGA